MNSGADSLIERRRLLREELWRQRQRLAHRLGPAAEGNGSYPRSVTMRFVSRHPVLAARLLTGVVNLFRTK